MPTPIRWQVPLEFSPEEARVAQTLRRIGKFYVFLRKIRAELFDEAFQAELAAGRGLDERPIRRRDRKRPDRGRPAMRSTPDSRSDCSRRTSTTPPARSSDTRWRHSSSPALMTPG